MSKVPISVCIIAKNEERYIEECLKRLMPYGFEIIVADTGSSDRTKEIAAKYADKVLDFEWIDDFGAARNFCAEKASNNWILSLDCDEYLSNADIRKIRILMQKFSRGTGIIKLKNLVGSVDSPKYTVDDVARFYNRKFYKYEGAIHEQIVFLDASKRNDEYPRFVLPMEVIHHGYAISHEEMVKKQQRNLGILYGSLEKSPEDPYIMFQIGQSEYIMRNYEKAAESYEKALALKPLVEYSYVEVMIWALAQAYRQLDRNEEALELMEKYSDECKSPRYLYMHATVCRENGQILKALLLYLKAVTLPEAGDLDGKLSDCYKNIIEIYRQMGKDDMADMFVDKYEASLAQNEKIYNS